jgi:tetratricopeptide (TPR) repeat protein
LDYNEVDVWIDFSSMLHQAGYVKEASEALMQGIKRFPDAAELNYRLGVVLLELSNNKAAMEYFAIGLEIDFQKHEDIFEYAPILKNNPEILNLIALYKK